MNAPHECGHAAAPGVSWTPLGLAAQLARALPQMTAANGWTLRGEHLNSSDSPESSPPRQANAGSDADMDANLDAKLDATPVDVMKVWLRFVRLNRRIYGLVTAELRNIDLSVPQFDVLSTLSEHEGLSQQELADRLYVTKGNVSGLVDRLVRNALVERRALAGDRRSHALHLTPEGHAIVQRGLAIQRAYVQRTLGTLGPADIAALDRIQRLWRASLDAG